MVSETMDDGRIHAVRLFNRFYTQKIGVLQQSVYQSPLSLTEARVLYELAHREQPAAAELVRQLGLDAGYLSRILRAFERQGLIAKRPSEADGRRSLLALKSRGRKVFAQIDARSNREVSAMLGGLSESEQTRLIEAMSTIEELLGEKPKSESPYVLRSPQPGDMGWIVHRHGALYAQEYGYDEHFEALVAEIVAKFVHHYDSKRERCWVAEKDGEIGGCVLLVKKSKTVAKLRLLLVEPSARGHGIGTRLVNECIRFARQAGYRKVLLWTQSELLGARQIYQKSGFQLVHEERHHSFGRDLTSETWELKL